MKRGGGGGGGGGGERERERKKAVFVIVINSANRSIQNETFYFVMPMALVSTKASQ